MFEHGMKWMLGPFALHDYVRVQHTGALLRPGGFEVVRAPTTSMAGLNRPGFAGGSNSEKVEP
jgi:hypothetical protein